MITVNNQYQPNSVILSPRDREFVNTVLNRITLYGQIPYTLPEMLVVDLIKSAAKYFYKYYSNALKTSYYQIDSKDIHQYAGTDNYRYISIIVDYKIRNVMEVHEINSKLRSYSYEDGDKFSTGTIAGMSVNKPELIGIDNNMYLIEYAVKMVEQRAYDNMFQTKMPISFSYETHELLFKRKPTHSGLILKVLKCVDIVDLYNDTFFERYIIATCKRELKRIIGSHTIELPGGATLNVDEVCNIDDIQIVEDAIKQSSGVGDIILKRN